MEHIQGMKPLTEYFFHHSICSLKSCLLHIITILQWKWLFHGLFSFSIYLSMLQQSEWVFATLKKKWFHHFTVQSRGPKYLILVLTQVSFNYWYLKSQLQSESLGEVFVGILNTCTHFHILLTNLYMTSEGNKWQVLQEQEIQNLNHNSILNQYPTCLLENPVIWNNHWFV